MKSPYMDLHVHSQYSHGEGSIRDIAKTAAAKKLAYVAVTEHVRYQSPWIGSFISEMETVKKQGSVKLLSGIESKVLDFCGKLDATERMIAGVDLVVASVHRIFSLHNMNGDLVVSKVSRDKAHIIELYLRALRGIASNPMVDVVGHPFHLLKAMGIKGIKKEDKMETAKLFAMSKKAVEVNSFYHVPDLEFLKMCLREGVKISIGSDAHRLVDVGNVEWSMRLFEKAGGTDNDLIDTEGILANKRQPE